MTAGNANHQIATTVGRKPSLPVLTVLITAVVMYIAQFALNDFYVGTYMDDANYIILAESIAEGRGYRQINYPDAPLETRYPPGYPVVLAPIIALRSDNLDLLKLPSVIAAALAVWLVWRLFGDRVSDRRKVLLALMLFSLNPLVVGHSVAVMSEGLFLLVALLAVWAIDRSRQLEGTHAIKWSLIAAVIAAICALVRTGGWMLLPAGLLSLALRRRWRAILIFTVAFLVLMLPWTLRNYQVTGALLSGDYQEQLTWQSAENHVPQALSISVLVKRGPCVKSCVN